MLIPNWMRLFGLALRAKRLGAAARAAIRFVRIGIRAREISACRLCRLQLPAARWPRPKSVSCWALCPIEQHDLGSSELSRSHVAV